jgi:hypothetical protein
LHESEEESEALIRKARFEGLVVVNARLALPPPEPELVATP